MGKRHKKKKTDVDRKSGGQVPADGGGRTDPDGAGAPEPESRARIWFRSNRTDLRFLLVFGSVMVVYYVATTTALSKESFFPWYLQKTAQISGAVMHATGYGGLTVDGNVMSSPNGSITVERGCDAIAPTALFVSAVLASPTPFLLKLPAVLGGMFVLMVLNVLRIITLFLTRMHWPKAFDIMHVDVWQVMFILFAILLWALWASWTTKRMQRPAHAPN